MRGPWPGGLGGVLKGRRILYAPRQPPTLVRLLRINTLLIYSLRCLASAVLMLTPWVGWDPGPWGDPAGGVKTKKRIYEHGKRILIEKLNTLLTFSVRCLVSAVLMLTPWVGPHPHPTPGPPTPHS